MDWSLYEEERDNLSEELSEEEENEKGSEKEKEKENEVTTVLAPVECECCRLLNVLVQKAKDIGKDFLLPRKITCKKCHWHKVEGTISCLRNLLGNERNPVRKHQCVQQCTLWAACPTQYVAGHNIEIQKQKKDEKEKQRKEKEEAEAAEKLKKQKEKELHQVPTIPSFESYLRSLEVNPDEQAQGPEALQQLLQHMYAYVQIVEVSKIDAAAAKSQAKRKTKCDKIRSTIENGEAPSAVQRLSVVLFNVLRQENGTFMGVAPLMHQCLPTSVPTNSLAVSTTSPPSILSSTTLSSCSVPSSLSSVLLFSTATAPAPSPTTTTFLSCIDDEGEEEMEEGAKEEEQQQEEEEEVEEKEREEDKEEAEGQEEEEEDLPSDVQRALRREESETCRLHKELHFVRHELVQSQARKEEGLSAESGANGTLLASRTSVLVDIK